MHERLPYEYSKCTMGLDEILKENWLIADKADKAGNNKELLTSLSLNQRYLQYKDGFID